MKYLAVLFLLLLQTSCKQNTRNYTHIIVENKIVNATVLQKIDNPEKALLSWYLFAYGNECTTDSNKTKCQILKLLAIDDECDKEHIDFLNKWLNKNILIQLKLRNCPSLPHKSAIQNNIEKIVIKRVSDTLSISIKVSGMNTIQEKFWTIEKTESLILNNNTLTKTND